MTDTILEIITTIRDMLARGPVSLGQVTFIGLEEARKRLGEADWQRHREKIRTSVEAVLSEHCTKADAFIRSAEDQYLVVFSGVSEEAAAIRAAAIASSVNSVLLGDQAFDGIRVHVTVTGIDNLSHSTPATVAEVIEALRQDAVARTKSGGGSPDDTLSLALERAVGGRNCGARSPGRRNRRSVTCSIPIGMSRRPASRPSAAPPRSNCRMAVAPCGIMRSSAAHRRPAISCSSTSTCWRRRCWR